ncbi:hypothetical protein Tco_0736251, partial [Tanacetum coccineum]
LEEGGEEDNGRSFMKKKTLSDRVLHLENERLNEKLEERNREIAKLKSQIEVQTGVTNQTLVEKKTDMKTKTDEEKPPRKD